MGTAPSRPKLLAIAAGLLLAAAVPGLRLRGEPKVLQRHGGVTVERVDEALVPQGERVDAKDGDLLLDNGRVQVVVGASSERGRALDFGAILDLTGPAWVDDGLSSMATALFVSGRRVPVLTERVEAVAAQPVPKLVVTARGTSVPVALTTEIALRAKGGVVEITTRAVNRGSRPLSVRLGDDVDWAGMPTFVPGHGDIEQGGKKTVSWFARRGPLSYGLVFPDAPAEVEFRANQSETDQTSLGPEVGIPPGEGATYRRVLVATQQGVSDVARLAAEFTGQPIGRITGVLAPAPAWALLTAIASDGAVAMRESARDDGTFELYVPPGHYRVQAQTPGGWDEAPVDVKAGREPSLATLVVPQAERLDFRITDPEGRLIPGRLVVYGLDGTPDPRFASVPRVSAAGNEVHTVSGEGRVDVPQGRYRVVVSRGIEWSVAEKIIDVRSEQGVALRVTLSHDLPTPGWISADLHLHAKPSGDSQLSLDDRVASLVSAGVEFAVATDHNHVTDYDATIEALQAHPLLKATSGVEVTTRTWGHFNAYPLSPTDAPPPHAGIEPPEIFAAIRKLSKDAVIQVNHPWRPGYGYFHRAALNERTGASFRKNFSFDFDLIEVINGYELADPEMVERNLRRYHQLLNLGRRYTAVGSSDSHKLTNEWAGYPRTYVRVADDRPERASATEIAAALKAGHTVVSLGPFVDVHVGEAGPGDTVATNPGTVPLDVSVRSVGWIRVNRVDIVVNGETFESIDIGETGRRKSLEWAQTVDLQVTRDSWVSVVVRGDHPLDEVLPGMHVTPCAFTNPLFIDVGEPEPAPVHRPARGRFRASPPPREPEPVPEADAGEEGGRGVEAGSSVDAADAVSPAPLDGG